MPTLEQTYRPLLEAISFAARAHRGQVRKDGHTPYASHPFRVCLVLSHVFGVTDPATLMTAALHDTIEDTTTDFDDLEEHFGATVAGWVALLSKDKRRQDDDREAAYRDQLASAPWQVKVCKLGDMFDNLLDAKHTTSAQRRRSLERSRGYFAILGDPDFPPPARRAYETVAALLDEVASLLV